MTRALAATLRRSWRAAGVLVAAAALIPVLLGAATSTSGSSLAGAADPAFVPPCQGATPNASGTGYVCPPASASSGGSITVPGNGSFTACGFTPGAPVTVTVNGQPYATFTADANGCVPLDFLTRTIDGLIQLSINGDPWVNIHCGANTIVLSSLRDLGHGYVQPYVYTFTLTVGGSNGTACLTSSVTPAGANGTSGTAGAGNGGAGAAGANNGAGSRGASGAGGAGASNAATSSGLATTGVEIGVTVAAALLLILLGALLLRASRRRREAA